MLRISFLEQYFPKRNCFVFFSVTIVSFICFWHVVCKFLKFFSRSCCPDQDSNLGYCGHNAMSYRLDDLDQLYCKTIVFISFLDSGAFGDLELFLDILLRLFAYEV